ncbi:hypothetical protein [Candidatus Rhodoblastus alkanivorans]|uniref:hypothetical protein n=1 Tax=Candidatus Rhodoblastus alkanivorans TaxID=2954117 RepID=UPI003014E5C4
MSEPPNGAGPELSVIVPVFNESGNLRPLVGRLIPALACVESFEIIFISKGLYAWIGFKSIGAPFEVAERHSGEAKFSYRKLTRFAFDGLVSFTTAPLKIWTYVGTAVVAFALANAVYYVLEVVIWGVKVPGFATLIVSIMFFAGVQADFARHSGRIY